MSDKKLEAFQMYYDGLDDFQKLNNVRATAWLFWFHGWDAGIAALEADNAALQAQSDKLAAALGDSVYGLDTLIQTCDGKFPSGSFEQGTINSMKMSLIFSKNALADWGKGE